MDTDTEIMVEKDISGVINTLCSNIEKQANDVIKRGGLFKIGLSGGSLVKFLCQGLPNIVTEWSQWRFFFCDERIVPFENEESTYGIYKNSLIGKIPIEESQFIKIDPALSVEKAAEDYITKMSAYFPTGVLPKFDVLLLGMGPDGHTCSLFPGHPLLKETDRWVCPINDSPKPPPSRITLTLPVINNADLCMIVVTGADKADVIERIFRSKEKLPVALVEPTHGKKLWLVDERAMEKLHG